MDAMWFHPKLVHVPLALGVLMPLLASGLLIAWWRKWLVRQSWIIVVLFQAVLFTSAIVAMRSGEAEEERVERVVDEQFIEAHEEAAEAFVWSSGIVFALMLIAYLAINKAAAFPLALAASLGTIVVFALGYRTGQAGGELVYRHGAASAYANPTKNTKPHHDQHDSD